MAMTLSRTTDNSSLSVIPSWVRKSLASCFSSSDTWMCALSTASRAPDVLCLFTSFRFRSFAFAIVSNLVANSVAAWGSLPTSLGLSTSPFAIRSSATALALMSCPAIAVTASVVALNPVPAPKPPTAPARAWSAACAGLKPAWVPAVSAPYCVVSWMASVPDSFTPALIGLVTMLPVWPPKMPLAPNRSAPAIAKDAVAAIDRSSGVTWSRPSFLARSSAIGEMYEAKYAGVARRAAAMSGKLVTVASPMNAKTFCGVGFDFTSFHGVIR